MPPSGATRERRTPSRCVQGSYAPERWWRGDQPWDRTTFSRASAERYDHTSSLVALVEPTAGVEPALARYEGAVPPATLRRRWSRLEDSNPDSPVIGRTSSCWTKPGLIPPAGVEPAWFRLKGGRMAALPRRVRRDSVGCRAGIRTRIFPVNSRTCCRCHHPTNGRVGRTRTSTRLRPRQVGCRLPYDPRTSWGERPESNRLERVSQTRGAPFAFAHRRIGSR